jgi:hypothetical protein
VIAVAWIALSRSASSTGLIASVTPLSIAGYALTALAIGALLMLARSAIRSEQGRRKTRGSIAPVRTFVPRTATEKRWFDTPCRSPRASARSFIYRGFLFAQLAAWLTEMPAAVVIDLSSGWITRQVEREGGLDDRVEPAAA